VWLLNGCFLIAQPAEDLVRVYVQKYRNHITDGETLRKIMQLPPKQVIEAFTPYTADSLAEIRAVGYSGIYKAGIRAVDASDRTGAVSQLIKALNDNDKGIAGQAAGYLTEFRKDDFNAESRYLLTQLAKGNHPYLYKIIRLTGYLDIDELVYNYNLMMHDERYRSREKMAMLLALARMGDSTSITNMMAKVSKLPVNDDVVYNIYPDLTYMRQKQAFDFLFDKILSDSKDCTSSNPDNEQPIICSFRIMEMVAPYVDDFPVKTDRWGELIITDYDKTLTNVRKWILENKDNYKLNNEIY
jgi:hypothetical protein